MNNADISRSLQDELSWPQVHQAAYYAHAFLPAVAGFYRSNAIYGSEGRNAFRTYLLLAAARETTRQEDLVTLMVSGKPETMRRFGQIRVDRSVKRAYSEVMPSSVKFYHAMITGHQNVYNGYQNYLLHAWFREQTIDREG